MEDLKSGICHSDLHQIKDDFGGTMFPFFPGHEMVGRVTAVGNHVTNFKVGELGAVGLIVDSCDNCEYCNDGIEQFCDQGTTYSFNSPDKYLGGATLGGFSETYVCHKRYVLHMPEFKDLAASSPLLCAGITVYSPLKHWQAEPEKKWVFLELAVLDIWLLK
jgi:uncharacterized zinc-type alcohol dehydrogenase-like protein